MNHRNLLMLASASSLMLSCGTGFLQKHVDEGTIEYALTFPGYDPNGLMAGMLPEKTTLCFTEDKQVAELSAGMGIFKTMMQVDNSGKSMDYHMSMMGKKIVAHLKPRDMDLFNKEYGSPTILFTNDADTIAGYPCKKAVAIFDRLEQPEIELWYTDRIRIQNPNWFGPFAEVPGVLLRYEMVQSGIRMHLDATSVTPGDIDLAKFNPQADFESVAPEALHQQLGEVLGTFSM
jgi:GLPGLI family protein